MAARQTEEARDPTNAARARGTGITEVVQAKERPSARKHHVQKQCVGSADRKRQRLRKELATAGEGKGRAGENTALGHWQIISQGFTRAGSRPYLHVQESARVEGEERGSNPEKTGRAGVSLASEAKLE